MKRSDSSLLYCFRLDKLSKPAAYYRRRAQAFKKILLDTASSLQDKKRFVAIFARRTSFLPGCATGNDQIGRDSANQSRRNRESDRTDSPNRSAPYDSSFFRWLVSQLWSSSQLSFGSSGA